MYHCKSERDEKYFIYSDQNKLSKSEVWIVSIPSITSTQRKASQKRK